MPFIEFESEVRALGPGVLTIGSGSEAGWRISGRGLDPVHVLVSLQPGGGALLIRGTPRSVVSINGAELAASRTLLAFGDRLTMGNAELRYLRLTPGATALVGYLRDFRRGRVYQLQHRSTIGRDLSSTVVVQEPDVSRLHAEVLRTEESYVVMPRGSSVTSVNGRRITTATTLSEGDEIAIGRTVLRFTHGGALATSAAASAARHSPPAGRESQAQTTFIGTIEARDHRSRLNRRRLTRAASIALAVIAVSAIVVSLYADRRSAARRSSSPDVAGRRSARPAAVSGSETRGEGARPASLPSPQGQR